MNLRAKKSTLKMDLRAREEGNNFLRMLVYLVVIIALAFAVFGSAVYFDGQSQRTNKIYRLQREIQNIKIAIEIKSKKEFIFQRIDKYDLGLRFPEPNQVVNIPPDLRKIDSNLSGKQVAYN
jgi:hypothetical protein